MHITKRAIDSFQYAGEGNRRDVRWDDGIRGLGVRIYPSGRKAFVLSYRTAGRKRLMALGDYGELTWAQAQYAARRALAAIREGSDPLEAKRLEITAPTVKALAEQYLEYSKAHKRSWKDDESRIRRHILPQWGSRKAKAVMPSEVAALHSRIGRTARYEANRTLALVHNLFEKASVWGFVDEGHPNPARNVEKFREHKRDRWVRPDELPALIKQINHHPNTYVRAALWLYLLTGVRKSELLQARWDEIDWQRAELRLGETKAGRTHYIPLSGPAIELLHDLPRREGNPYVLPGAREGHHLVNIAKPWRQVREVAGVPDIRLHDLRRTVGSWMAQAGNSLHLIGRVLNHSNASTTAVYARFGEDQVRQALEQHAERLTKAAMGSKAEVVPLHAGSC